jgi:peptidoglycan/xylan/chitin deacetylase (PgdA/CDA1 family)
MAPVKSMNAVRQTTSRLIRNVFYYGGLSRLVSLVQRRPRILMLHGVNTPESPASAFRAQLIFLMRSYRIVPLDQIWTSDSTTRDMRPQLALTFDDGLRNNFTAAYPILKEYSAPATFFVCPGLIDSGRWLWNHECRARLAQWSSEERRQLAESLGMTSGEIEPIIQRMKNMSSADRQQIEAILRKATPDFIPTADQRQRFDIMTWEELKTLDEGIITIGGHSTNHEILPQLNAEQLESEIADCKSWLERQLGRRVHHFCYPDGAYNTQVLSCVGRHYTSGVTTNAGWVPSEPSLLELPRIAMDLNLPDLAWKLQRPTS